MSPPPRQGFPDYLIISPNGSHAYLEFKVSKNATHQPNQDWWIEFLDRGNNFAGFVYPENFEEVRKTLIKLLI
jgi:hypothetical protein